MGPRAMPRGLAPEMKYKTPSVKLWGEKGFGSTVSHNFSQLSLSLLYLIPPLSNKDQFYRPHLWDAMPASQFSPLRLTLSWTQHNLSCPKLLVSFLYWTCWFSAKFTHTCTFLPWSQNQETITVYGTAHLDVACELFCLTKTSGFLRLVVTCSCRC